MSDICGNCNKPYKEHYFEHEIFCFDNTNGDIFIKKDMEYFKDKFSGNAEEFDSIVVDMFETIKAKEAHHKEAVREAKEGIIEKVKALKVDPDNFLDIGRKLALEKNKAINDVLQIIDEVM